MPVQEIYIADEFKKHSTEVFFLGLIDVGAWPDKEGMKLKIPGREPMQPMSFATSIDATKTIIPIATLHAERIFTIDDAIGRIVWVVRDQRSIDILRSNGLRGPTPPPTPEASGSDRARIGQ